MPCLKLEENKRYQQKQKIDFFIAKQPNTQIHSIPERSTAYFNTEERKNEQPDSAQKATPLKTLLDAIKNENVLENIISTQSIDYLKWSVSFLLLSIAPAATVFCVEDPNSQSRLLFVATSMTSLWHIVRNKYHGTPVIESVSDQASTLISGFTMIMPLAENPLKNVLSGVGLTFLMLNSYPPNKTLFYGAIINRIKATTAFLRSPCKSATSVLVGIPALYLSYYAGSFVMGSMVQSFITLTNTTGMDQYPLVNAMMIDPFWIYGTLAPIYALAFAFALKGVSYSATPLLNAIKNGCMTSKDTKQKELSEPIGQGRDGYVTCPGDEETSQAAAFSPCLLKLGAAMVCLGIAGYSQYTLIQGLKVGLTSLSGFILTSLLAASGNGTNAATLATIGRTLIISPQMYDVTGKALSRTKRTIDSSTPTVTPKVNLAAHCVDKNLFNYLKLKIKAAMDAPGANKEGAITDKEITDQLLLSTKQYLEANADTIENQARWHHKMEAGINPDFTHKAALFTILFNGAANIFLCDNWVGGALTCAISIVIMYFALDEKEASLPQQIIQASPQPLSNFV